MNNGNKDPIGNESSLFEDIVGGNKLQGLVDVVEKITGCVGSQLIKLLGLPNTSSPGDFQKIKVSPREQEIIKNVLEYFLSQQGNLSLKVNRIIQELRIEISAYQYFVIMKDEIFKDSDGEFSVRILYEEFSSIGESKILIPFETMSTLTTLYYQEQANRREKNFVSRIASKVFSHIQKIDHSRNISFCALNFDKLDISSISEDLKGKLQNIKNGGETLIGDFSYEELELLAQLVSKNARRNDLVAFSF